MEKKRQIQTYFLDKSFRRRIRGWSIRMVGEVSTTRENDRLRRRCCVPRESENIYKSKVNN